MLHISPKKLDLKPLNNSFNSEKAQTDTHTGLNMGLHLSPKVIHQALAYGNGPPCVLPDLTADRLFSENGAMLSIYN